jgi:drug/metabolite transporter (DMT)-like permease
MFREHLPRQAAIAAILVVGGATVLAYVPDELGGQVAGIAAIAAACLCWAIDNNLSQRLSVRDPVAIVRVKTGVAGGAMLAIAALTDSAVPDWRCVAAALAVGIVSYGVSLVFDMYALRMLGAAREATYFATAPFIGAVLAIPIVGDAPAIRHAVAGTLMAAGVVLLARERHEHEHAHEALEHDHLHVHDEHHHHAHEGRLCEPHSHPHRHPPLVHSHAHASDVHHRHRHP